MIEKLYEFLQEQEIKPDFAKDDTMRLTYKNTRPRRGVIVIPGDDSEDGDSEEDEDLKTEDAEEKPRACPDEECEIQVEV